MSTWSTAACASTSVGDPRLPGRSRPRQRNLPYRQAGLASVEAVQTGKVRLDEVLGSLRSACPKGLARNAPLVSRGEEGTTPRAARGSAAVLGHANGLRNEVDRLHPGRAAAVVAASRRAQVAIGAAHVPGRASGGRTRHAGEVERAGEALAARIAGRADAEAFALARAAAAATTAAVRTVTGSGSGHATAGDR